MTTYTRTSRPVTERAAGHYIHRDHTVTGTPTQLANLVANHRNAGTFVTMTSPRPVTDNRFQVVIRLREYQTTQANVRVTPAGDHDRRSRRTRIAVIATTVTGTVAGLVTAAAYLLGQLVELIAAHAGLILAVLVLAAFLTGLVARLRSGDRHCPGC